MHKKRTKQDTFPFFINLLLFVFLYMYVLYFIVCICSFVLWHSWLLFFLFSSLTILCIEYQVFHNWNSGANLCREEENLVFCLARYSIQHWISPNQDDLSHSARTFISGWQNGWAAKHTLFGLRRRPARTCLWSPLLSDAL